MDCTVKFVLLDSRLARLIYPSSVMPLRPADPQVRGHPSASAGTLETNTERTAAYPADTAIILKLDTFRNSDTSKDRMMMHTETTTSWMFLDDLCDIMANGAMMKTAVSAAVVTRPMTSAISIVFWYVHRCYLLATDPRPALLLCAFRDSL